MDSDQHVFLRTLFDRRPDDAFVLIWTAAGKLSRWFQSYDEACAYVDGIGQKDCYAGTGYRPNDFGPYKRGKSKDVCALTWLYADLDYGEPDDEAHTKKNLPPTEADAKSLVMGQGTDPSILIHSGHGLQAYWLLDKTWIFSDPSDNVEAGVLSRMMGSSIQARGKARGWSVDSVHDLARVLRIPGTWNTKAGVPVQARLLFYNPSITYTRIQLEDILKPKSSKPQDQAAPAPPPAVRQAQEDSTLSFDPDPPQEKLEALIEMDPVFEQTWRGLRADLESLSEIDLSLSSFAVRAGWTDSEIASLIAAYRRRMGKRQDSIAKGYRQDYLAKTIKKARQGINEEKEYGEIERLADLPEQEFSTPDVRSGILELISNKLGIKICGVVKFLEEPPIYAIKVGPASILELGDVGEIIERLKFRKHIAATYNILIPRMKDRAWDSIARALLRLIEEQRVSETSTAEGEMKVWIQEYLEGKPPVNMSDSLITRCPFIENDRWHFYIDSFYRWTLARQMSDKKIKDFVRAVKKYGCTEENVYAMVRERWVHRRVWRVPKNWRIEQDPPDEYNKYAKNQDESEDEQPKQPKQVNHEDE